LDADEFLKTVEPAGKPSRLKPFLPDMLKLREANYTLEQVKEFLTLNGVEISVSGIAAYLKRHDNETAKQSKTAVASPALSPPKAQPKEKKESSQSPQSKNKSAERNHRPADLDEIIGSTPDLDQLVKQAKRTKQKE